jgi:energy-coupling factor transporter ATP-binding protein EcfA2
MKSTNSNLVLSVRDKSLTELTKNNLNYVLLRRPKLSEPNGDVDILVKDLNKAHNLLLKLNYLCFSKSKNNQKYIRFDHSLEKWTHLDVQSNIKLKKFWSPDSFTDVLLNSKVTNEGINFLVSSHEKIITILHAGVNKGFYDKEYFERISNLDFTKLEKYIINYSFLPLNLKELLYLVDAFTNGKIIERELINYLNKYFPEHKKTIKNYTHRLINRISSFFCFKRGVAILGPDGSGKSTLISPLSKLEWPSVKKQYMGPSSKEDMNDFIFNLLNYFSKIRDKYSKRNPIGMFSRVMWVVICYIDYLNRYFRNNWFHGSKGLIVFDRFPCDMYFRKPTIFNEIIFLMFFPRPKHVFLCVGDSKIIYNRKKELLSPKEVEDTIILYRQKLTKYKINFHEIDTTKLTIEMSNYFIHETLINNNFFIFKNLLK